MRGQVRLTALAAGLALVLCGAPAQAGGATFSARTDGAPQAGAVGRWVTDSPSEGRLTATVVGAPDRRTTLTAGWSSGWVSYRKGDEGLLLRHGSSYSTGVRARPLDSGLSFTEDYRVRRAGGRWSRWMTLTSKKAQRVDVGVVEHYNYDYNDIFVIIVSDCTCRLQVEWRLRGTQDGLTKGDLEVELKAAGSR